MAFEWDPRKNAVNIGKYGVEFADAVAIFDGPVLERVDDRRDYGEERVIAFGVAHGREFAVVYTRRGSNKRIISARRANSDERQAYRKTHPHLARPQ